VALDEERLVAVERTIVTPDGSRRTGDHLVREEPLEIRIGGVPLAVVMRTPGDDLDLVRGFLVTERIIEGLEQVRSLRHCTTAEAPEAEDNVVQVVLQPGVEIDLARLRRNLFASSSCGICGKATIENAMFEVGRPIEAAPFAAAAFLAMPDRLRENQAVFELTGGLHAAGLFDENGIAKVVREDIGRHNAVDKVVGWASRSGQALDRMILFVSGRVSYEIAQKALSARIPAVAGVSAPSSLAVDLALEGGITLVGFLREGRMSVYAGRVEDSVG
jgi:FdhD protein